MYHEYTTIDGKTQRRHYNGIRQADDTVYIVHPAGDEPHWRAKCGIACRALAEQIGEHEYVAWFERTFETDGKTSNDFTWRQMYEAAEYESEHPTVCECRDLPDGRMDVCPLCKSMARVRGA